MNRSIFVVFLLVLVVADLSSAWRRRRMGWPDNKDAKIPKEMKLQREPESVQSANSENSAPAMYSKMNEDRLDNDLHHQDSFVEDDNEL
ncbi:Hypothetical predicted protein [Paramuricea clavata]|uniref:Uncharacterized protein n=1 Tax=Paramuricea clavata TaxID=317549 RepID=A0A6S7IDQ5_PARCT|nr:Hypothetical predicted protein [Paramuricea clavata]